MVAAIHEWHRSQLQAQQRVLRHPVRLVLGLAVWGEHHTRLFLDYGLPSIYGSKADMVIVVYADEHAHREIGSSAAFGCLPVRLEPLPAAFTERISRQNDLKYVLMSAVHNLCVHEAGRRGAGFSMGIADHVYSAGFFDNLLRLSERHDGITHSAIWASHAIAAFYLREPRHAAALGTIGISFANRRFRSWCMNDTAGLTSLPGAHLVHWRGRDSVRLHSPHVSPIWISPDRCYKAPTTLVDGTMDSDVASYMQGEFHMVQREDDMTLITLNDDLPPSERVGFDAFKRGIVHMGLQNFRRACVVPTLPAADGFIADADMERDWQNLLSRLEA